MSTAADHALLYEAVQRGTATAASRVAPAGLDAQHIGGGAARPDIPHDLCVTLTQESQRTTLRAEEAVGAFRTRPATAEQLAEIAETLASAPWDMGPIRSAVVNELSDHLSLYGLPTYQAAELQTESLESHGVHKIARQVAITIDREALHRADQVASPHRIPRSQLELEIEKRIGQSKAARSTNTARDGGRPGAGDQPNPPRLPRRP